MSIPAPLTVQSTYAADAITWCVDGPNYSVVACEGEAILSDPLVYHGEFQMPQRRFVDGRKFYRAIGYTVLHAAAAAVPMLEAAE